MPVFTVNGFPVKHNYKKIELQLKSWPHAIYSEDITWSSVNTATFMPTWNYFQYFTE